MITNDTPKNDERSHGGPMGDEGETQQILDHCARWLQRYPDAVRSILVWAFPANGLPRLREHVSKLHDISLVFDRDLLVAVCGENGAGKSTLINAILGQGMKIALTDFFECRTIPLVCKYGDSPGATIEDSDGNEINLELSELAEELRKRLERGEGLSLKRIVAVVPCEAIRGMQLADVPGLGADEDTQAVAEAFQDTVDAAIFVVNAARIGHAGIEQQAHRIIRDVGVVAIVINKMDIVGFENSKRAVNFVEERVPGTPVFPMAAEQAYLSRESSRAHQLLFDLKTRFLERLSRDASAVKITSSLGKCHREVAAVSNLLLVAYRLAGRDLAQFDETCRRFENRRSGYVQSCLEKINQWFADTPYKAEANQLFNRLAKASNASKDQFEARIREEFTPAVYETQIAKLNDYLADTVQVERRRISDQLDAEIREKFSPFKIEATAARTRASGQYHKPNAPNDPGDSTRQMVAKSAGAGVISGSLATALTVATSATATIASAATGVGLVTALAAGMGVMIYRVWDKWSDRLSPGKLNEWIAETRHTLVDQLRSNSFPDGIEAALNADFDNWLSVARNEYLKRMWDPNEETVRQSLQEFSSYLDEGERLLRNVVEFRHGQVGSSSTAHRGEQLWRGSAAAAKARLTYATPIRYLPHGTHNLKNDLSDIFSLEDVCLDIVDGGLTSVEIGELSRVPRNTLIRLLVSEVEHYSEKRVRFVESLDALRADRSGSVAARIVKFTDSEQTPLERVIVAGCDWMLELSVSLSAADQREITVRTVPDDEQGTIRAELVDRFWSRDETVWSRMDAVDL